MCIADHEETLICLKSLHLSSKSCERCRKSRGVVLVRIITQWWVWRFLACFLVFRFLLFFRVGNSFSHFETLTLLSFLTLLVCPFSALNHIFGKNEKHLLSNRFLRRWGLYNGWPNRMWPANSQILFVFCLDWLHALALPVGVFQPTFPYRSTCFTSGLQILGQDGRRIMNLWM